MTRQLLQLDDVTRLYSTGGGEVVACDRVSFSVAEGELVVVMGPSGSGKSTVLSLAGGLDTPSAGRVLVDGADLADLREPELAAVRRSLVGYVFQDFNLVPSLTALENAALPLDLGGVPASTWRSEARAALLSVGVDDLSARFPSAMSGGQQQRVAIARALVGQRCLLLADEATGSLDSDNSFEVMSIIRRQCDAGLGAVVVTHDANVETWADRVIEMKDGRIVDERTAQRVYV